MEEAVVVELFGYVVDVDADFVGFFVVLHEVGDAEWGAILNAKGWEGEVEGVLAWEEGWVEEVGLWRTEGVVEQVVGFVVLCSQAGC